MRKFNLFRILRRSMGTLMREQKEQGFLTGCEERVIRPIQRPRYVMEVCQSGPVDGGEWKMGL